MNYLCGFKAFVNVWFRSDTDVQARWAFEISNCHVYIFIGKSDTSLLLFLKGHICKPVNTGGMF